MGVTEGREFPFSVLDHALMAAISGGMQQVMAMAKSTRVRDGAVVVIAEWRGKLHVTPRWWWWCGSELPTAMPFWTYCPLICASSRD